MPVLLVNAQDDPLVAEFLLETAEDYASKGCSYVD